MAAVGLAVNVAGALLLHAGSRTSLNVRGAYNEVLADALSSVGVIVGATVMRATGWLWVDPAVAAAIAALGAAADVLAAARGDPGAARGRRRATSTSRRCVRRWRRCPG